MEFDDYAGEYEGLVRGALAFSGADHERLLAAKVSQLCSLARRELGSVSTSRILDVGCGIGSLERHLTAQSRFVAGADVALRPLRRAVRETTAAYAAYDGAHLPFADHSFDLVFSSSVLHHVRREDRRPLVCEMGRVTRLGGLVAVLEHNPWNPVTRLIVSRCVLDRDAELLTAGQARGLLRQAGLQHIGSRYTFFSPWTSSLWTRFEQGFGWLPFGAQYIVFGRRSEGTT